METSISNKQKDIKPILSDVLLDITWSKIAKRYFGKSSSWMYNKINGIDGNGGTGGFTDAEREQLKGALIDFSFRLRTVSEQL